MNRAKNDLETKNKIKKIVSDNLPSFASRYFKANMETKSLQSLYGYALDLTSFFEYLKYREPDSFDIARMTISDLNELSPSVIEDYLNYSREYTDKGETKTRSDATIKRRYSSLSSFIAYYYKLDMIDRNPADKVKPPIIRKQVPITPSVKANREIFSELVNINIEDVNLDECYIVFYGRKNHKRIIYISYPTAAVIGRYLADRLEIIPEHGHDEALFLSLRAQRIGVRTVQYMIKKYTEVFSNGDAHLTPESIHQSFRNDIFMQSMSIPVTSDICGIDRDTLMQYYSPYVDDYESRKGQEFQ